jgi:hypothetical protein
MEGTCVNAWCSRPAHYSDGRCKPCRRREVWGPLHAEDEREKGRQRRAEQRALDRRLRATQPQFFEPPEAA